MSPTRGSPTALGKTTRPHQENAAQGPSTDRPFFQGRDLSAFLPFPATQEVETPMTQPVLLYRHSDLQGCERWISSLLFRNTLGQPTTPLPQPFHHTSTSPLQLETARHTPSTTLPPHSHITPTTRDSPPHPFHHTTTSPLQLETARHTPSTTLPPHSHVTPTTRDSPPHPFHHTTTQPHHPYN
ncbi:hypothetical protein GWK47_046892 [Chionoecetes opilio]|uniref:Uncharacterized protein n=1 Tax=Chionoecetes opilio TaxID=41210 RepID=A0A8J4Y4A1_CHIOP|nr:hypothetical protein GWK47_046892 [Chionoecetes opilio]